MDKTIVFDAKGEEVEVIKEIPYPPIDLVDTVEDMNSDDYERRFVAEYYQTKIRYDKLHKMIIKAEAGTLKFKPKCPISLLREQKTSMGNYLHCLEIRAEVEGINLF